jgi:hypothetical protein
MAFIGYLKFASVICLYAALAIIVSLRLYYRSLYSEPE